MHPTIEWKDGEIHLIDQTKLPGELVIQKVTTLEDLWEAIHSLRVRGAPALGVAGAFGVLLGMKGFSTDTSESFCAKLDKVITYLASSRPTAVNLFWALERMRDAVRDRSGILVAELYDVLCEEAKKIVEDDQRSCRAIGACGAELIHDGAHILTHCNAGSLATYDYGTALGVFYAAHEQGKRFKVYVPETRPLLQGARLTSWELTRRGIDCTLITDSMAAFLMQQGEIDLVITGADRIVSNGDTANKIGTYSHAVNAAYHDVPFYIAAPCSTFDLSISSGKDIPIEERDPDEVRCFRSERTAPQDVSVYNPAFDVTPAQLIHAFITDVGMLQPPYDGSFEAVKGKDRSARI